jgi:steroid 5-alpha reductase family enzyme
MVLISAVAGFLAVAMAGAWLVQRRTGNSGWIDAVWSFATGAAGMALALGADAGGRGWLAAGMVGVWGGRLGLHIAVRSAGAADDPRYAALREEWGEKFHARLFWFLMIQAACAFVLALCVWAGVRQGAAFPAVTDFLAVLVMVAGILGEGVADAQLRAFRADRANKGMVCERGLWAWSRHPNYFFEWLVWLAWPVMAFGTWWMALAVAGPVLMYWLLVYASGIPPLEAQMVKSRGERYRDYQLRVSAFFPLPPRKI